MHNRMHDWSYKLGFTETAWNFQRDNDTKGGLGNDPVLGYSQSGAQSGSRNNANFGTPGDGASPRMQMYMWIPTRPFRDGDMDGDVIAHEYGHGVSSRLVGGGSLGYNGRRKYRKSTRSLVLVINGSPLPRCWFRTTPMHW